MTNHIRHLQNYYFLIPCSSGTWRTHALADESALTKVSSSLPIEYAATIGVNPSAAYRMLEDFVKLKQGDVVIQNGANSAVGQAVIQLAKVKGVKTINIIRDMYVVLRIVGLFSCVLLQMVIVLFMFCFTR